MDPVVRIHFSHDPRAFLGFFLLTNNFTCSNKCARERSSQFFKKNIQICQNQNSLISPLF